MANFFNVTSNVSQFGPDDCDINRYKQAGEYAAESKYWACQSKKYHDDTITDVTNMLENAGDQATLVALAQPTGAGKIGVLQGGTIQDAISYITPEMYGPTGRGNESEDTEALLWAISQSPLPIKLDDSKSYNITPNRITHYGPVFIDAGSSEIICDGIAIEIIDGSNSIWKGGIFKSKSIPWTVVYNDDFSIKESGYLGYGRMPYQDDINVDPSYYYQKICCALVFRSSTSNIIDGISISGVRGSYSSIVVAGFKNAEIRDCKIRGGSFSGGIVLLNDCQFPVTSGFGWNGQTSTAYSNPYKWGRGVNNKIINCDVFESRQMGIFATGCDYLTITDCQTYDNSESGVQTGQYSSSYPEESIICKHVNMKGCNSWGNYYDGFDHATVTNGANGPYFNKYLTMVGCESNKNKSTGLFVQGNNVDINNCSFINNGGHGVSIRDSSVVNVLNNRILDNGILSGGYQVVAVGSDFKIKNNIMTFNDSLVDAHLVNLQIGKQDIINFSFIAEDIPFTTYSSPDVVLGIGVITGGIIKTQNGDIVSFSGARSQTYIPQPRAGNTDAKYIASEGGSVSAWRHPYSGAYVRMSADSLSGITNGPMTLSYNWGRNTLNPDGYADNAGLGGTKIGLNPTSFNFSIRAAGSFSEASGMTIGVNTFRPNSDNTTTCGEVRYRFTQFVSSNSTIATCDADHKTDPRNILDSEINAFYEIGKLPWVWQWLHRVAEEGESARLHSGPTVQAAISIMDKHGLDWRKYSTFCYDEWGEQGGRASGHVYSFRKEELLLWIVKATIEKQIFLERRVEILESSMLNQD